MSIFDSSINPPCIIPAGCTERAQCPAASTWLHSVPGRKPPALDTNREGARGGLTWLHPARRPRAPQPLDIVSWISGSGKMRLTLMRLHFLNGRHGSPPRFPRFSNPRLRRLRERRMSGMRPAERRAVNASYICVFFFFPSFYLDDNTLQNTFFPPFSFEFNIRFDTHRMRRAYFQNWQNFISFAHEFGQLIVRNNFSIYCFSLSICFRSITSLPF